MSATSQHADGARSFENSSTHTNPQTPNRSVHFHPSPPTKTYFFLQRKHPANCISPSLKMNLGKVQGYHIYFVPHMVSICAHIFLGADTWGSFGIRSAVEEALNPLPFSHQSSVWALPRRHMLTDFTVNLTQYCFMPRGVHTHTHSGILRSIFTFFECRV